VFRRFRAKGDSIVVSLSSTEVAVLRNLAEELGGLMQGGVPERGSDPVRERLFPRAYLDPTEDEAESDWQSVVHEDLVRDRAAALQAVIGALDRAGARRGDVQVTLSRPEVEQWVGALNDGRLALGVALDLEEDGEAEDDLPLDDPRAPTLELYRWLTYLQGELVDVLLRALPDQGDD
jgi:hypothetical protein